MARMTRRALPAAAVAVTVAVAVTGLTGCGDDDPAGRATPSASASTAPASATPTTSSPGLPSASADPARVIVVAVMGGKVSNGLDSRQRVEVGKTVRLQVSSDERDEVHVHGYDLEVPVGPGLPGTVQFEATLPGQWAVELHDAGTELFTLVVG